VQRKEGRRSVTDPLREYRHTGPVLPKARTTLANVTPPRDLLTQLAAEDAQCPRVQLSPMRQIC
jgi:hypothetical protein